MDAWATIAPLYDRQDEYVQYARRFVKDQTDAEDVCHEAFMALKKRLESGRKVKKPAAYLRLEIRQAAKIRNRDDTRIRDTHPSLATLTEARQLDTAGEALFSVSFNSALSALDDQERAAFVLCELRGLTQYEAAQQMGVSQQTVSLLYEDARRSLAEEMA